MEIHSLLFLLTGLNSQSERLSGQVHNPREGPSTSRHSDETDDTYEHRQFIPPSEARHHNQPDTRPEEIEDQIFGRGHFIPPEEAGLHPDMRLPALEAPSNLLYEKNGNFYPLRVFASATLSHYTLGRIENGYVRPLYNQHRKMVIINDKDNTLHEITEKDADELGINKPLPADIINRSSRRPEKKRGRNQHRYK